MVTAQKFLHRSFTLKQILGWLGRVLALLVLGAHFYRASQYGMVLSAAGVIFFACTPSVWKQYAVAFFLFWGVIEWGESAFVLAAMRQHMGLPWMRAALILGVVGLLTGLAGKYTLRHAHARNIHSQENHALFQGLVFIAVFVSLFYLRQGAKMNFLLLERFLPLMGSMQIFAAAWYAAWIGGKLVDPRQSRKVRCRVWLVFALVFFAQFFLGVLGVEQMLLTGKLHVPVPAFILFAPIFRGSFTMMPIIVLASILLAGNAWCSLLCYFGPFDALAAGSKPVRLTQPAVHFALRYGRSLVLITGGLTAWGLRMAGISLSAAISTATAYALVSLLVMAIVSRKYGAMLHCTMLCPMGLVTSLLGRISVWRVRVNPALCDNCGACEKNCAYSAITQESRAAGRTLLRCSLCRDCIGVCRSRAIFLHFPGLSPDTAWKFFTGLVTVLHVLFLSVAMV